MNQINTIRSNVKAFMSGIEPGHDWLHIQRVEGNALRIHQHEGGNQQVIQLAALLHDLTDRKFFNEHQSMNVIKQWFYDLSINQDIADHVFEIIKNLSFSSELNGATASSLEFAIVQDADRLEALGAIGIARTFSYGATRQRSFFHEGILPIIPDSQNEYHSTQSPTINHFFEKLLTLHCRMKTATGRKLALERHQFLITYLNQFIDEWSFSDTLLKDKWLTLIKSYEIS